MTYLAWIRHGVTDWNEQKRAQGQTDVPLNARGRRQAELLAARLVEDQESWDAIYASDLSRAYETAETIGRALGLPVVADARLREIGFGQVEGTTPDERIRKWGEHWAELPLGKEETPEAIERLTSFMEDMAAKHPNERLLVVSHGAFIGLALRHLIPELNTDEHLRNTSVTKIRRTELGWACELYNCSRHVVE